MNLDHAFAALANAKRRAIVARLVRGDTTVVELAKPLGISLPAALKHLKVLEDALIVTNDQRGKYGLCRLRREALASAAEWINFHRTFWKVNLVLDPDPGRQALPGSDDYEIEVDVTEHSGVDQAS